MFLYLNLIITYIMETNFRLPYSRVSIESPLIQTSYNENSKKFNEIKDFYENFIG